MTIVQKKKIINDPVYGFVSIPAGLIYDLIEQPWFQRLRRIRQLGLTHYVYPGAQHTRFQHVIGAVYLTQQAIEILRSKGIDISDQEQEAVCAAVLLHDMGHGPYSHTLEYMLVKDVSHEAISIHYMNLLNQQMSGRLDMCIDIFSNKYPKKFLHQLVSSQLDMDRLDYLRRDSFFTGVIEGAVGNDRIINMLNVINNELVVDEKGIYSVEKFLIARRLMYWQVYLHKTVISAESLLIKILERARQLANKNVDLFGTPALIHFLNNDINKNNFFANPENIGFYSDLDDEDVFTAIKVWCHHSDEILRKMCTMLRDRKLFKTELSKDAITEERLNEIKENIMKKHSISATDIDYFVFTDSVKNRAYDLNKINIKILYKNGEVKDIAKASDLDNIEALGQTVTKYYLCYLRTY
ncbi:MAG: HD domain-containing protein [Bacteroidetes bacterium]|nr:HD domain-containing protein [Bacteroidota bacterium]